MYDNEFKKNHFGIYCIKCEINNLMYIGQTSVNFYKRWIHHLYLLRKNKHSNKMLQNYWNKYGEENFSIYPIKFFDINEGCTNIDLDELEAFYINKYDTLENGFNLNAGGNGNRGYKQSDETKRKIGEKNKINMTGKRVSDEVRDKMSKSHKGKEKTVEHRKHLSESLKGIKRTDETKEKCRITNQGSKQKTAKYTEETIEKMRIDNMNGLSVTQVSEKYGINRGTTYGILKNLRWKHVVPEGWIDFLNKK